MSTEVMHYRRNTYWQPLRLLPFLVLLLLSSTEARHLLGSVLQPIHPQVVCYSQQDCTKARPVQAAAMRQPLALPTPPSAILPLAQTLYCSGRKNSPSTLARAGFRNIFLRVGGPRAPPAWA